MSDLISRQAAIDALVAETIYTEEELKEYYEANSHRNEWLNGIYESIETVKQLPPIQPDNCSEFPNNSDAISRAAAIDALDKCYCGGKDENGRPWIYKENAVEVIEMVEPLPSAEPKRGKWISADAIFGGVPFYCSECGENTWDTVMGKPRWNFCPNCGADMREVTT